MSEFDDAQELTQLQKAEFAAQRFAEVVYRECSTWTVVAKKTYGVRSLFRDVKSELIKEIVVSKNMNHIRVTSMLSQIGVISSSRPMRRT